MIVCGCHEDSFENLQDALSLAKFHTFSMSRPIKQYATTPHKAKSVIWVSSDGREFGGKLRLMETFCGTLGAGPLLFRIPHLHVAGIT